MLAVCAVPLPEYLVSKWIPWGQQDIHVGSLVTAVCPIKSASVMLFFKKKHPYTKQLTISPPKPADNREGVAIVACVKNEADYLSEWLRFHEVIGVRQFIIYLDQCDDETEEILLGHTGPAKITIIPWAGRMVDTPTSKLLNSQVIAFSHAIQNFGSNYQWMAFIDADEFLLPKTGNTIEEALTGARGFPNISLPWHMFGPGRHDVKPDGGVLRNFTWRAANPLTSKKNVRNYKCIVDPCAVSEVSVHHFSTQVYGEQTSNDRGEKFSRKGRKDPRFYSAEYIQLNHYYSKSREELRRKLARGPASPASRARYEERVLSAVANIESEQIEDRSMVYFLDRIGFE